MYTIYFIFYTMCCVSYICLRRRKLWILKFRFFFFFLFVKISISTNEKHSLLWVCYTIYMRWKFATNRRGRKRHSFLGVGISEHGTSSMRYLDTFTLRTWCNALRMDEDNSWDKRVKRGTVLQASYEITNITTVERDPWLNLRQSFEFLLRNEFIFFFSNKEWPNLFLEKLVHIWTKLIFFTSFCFSPRWKPVLSYFSFFFFSSFSSINL